MENALQLYANVIGINKEVFNVIDDAENCPAANKNKFHRVLIRKVENPLPLTTHFRFELTRKSLDNQSFS